MVLSGFANVAPSQISRVLQTMQEYSWYLSSKCSARPSQNVCIICVPHHVYARTLFGYGMTYLYICIYIYIYIYIYNMVR